MENKKQSSIEWLQDCLSIHFTHDQKMQFEGLFQQAKAINKEEMKDCYLSHVSKAERLRLIFDKQFEEYYTKTFGGNHE